MAIAVYVFFGDRDDSAGDGAPIALVRAPETLSARARLGQKKYDANCAACHGQNAAGQDGIAPPLVHVIYEPGHHGDESFQRAVAFGVPAHHWRFGDMPPVEGLTRSDVASIVAYIRELQRTNGIL
ncbi:MAG: cytochrome c [Albidovulum sp.]|nr:cytochrome c [Albidovulum sp.]MDE0307382.1 cytochrome c [Albidovulum sp.]MDE0531138.1 cytochrome c [Albidovulum sp.]